MSQRSRIAVTGDEVVSFIEEQPGMGTARFAPHGPVLHGSVRTPAEPNDVRYGGSVQSSTRLDDASVVGETAAERYALIVEPTNVASQDHRKLTGPKGQRHGSTGRPAGL